jgi:hypothetical protein
MIIRKAPPRQLGPNEPIRHRDLHRRPVSRRDFIAQGFLGGAATVIAPTVFGLFANPRAARAALWLFLRSVVPVLDDLAVGDAEHVEPGRRIGLPLAREVGQFAAKREHDDVVFRDDADEVVDRLFDRLRRALAEELHERGAARRDVRVVLDVVLGEAR